MGLTYDEVCSREFSFLESKVDRLFFDVDVGCPYGLQSIATFHQAIFAPLGERTMELFLASGYRRNGNCLYSMRCGDCSDCIPIRLHAEEFRPNRNQRRTLKKNDDVVVTVMPLRFSMENLNLCERFLQARYPKESNTAQGYYQDFFFNNIVNSAQLQYRVGNRLVGTAIIDIGLNWVNAVYFYFDPEESSRSLGTYNILYLVELCRKWGVKFLYLGYLIHSVPAMSYKKDFCPHYLFSEKKWQRGK